MREMDPNKLCLSLHTSIQHKTYMQHNKHGSVYTKIDARLGKTQHMNYGKVELAQGGAWEYVDLSQNKERNSTPSGKN